MTPLLAFDIETVPDIAGLRVLHEIDPSFGDAEVAEFVFRERRAKTGNDFLPLHLQRVVAIACALREGDGFRCWSLGAASDSEAELIRRFFDGIEKYTPQLNYRALIHGVTASRYWEWGDDDRDFRGNNYVSRYHRRHIDLMDLLAMYQPRNNAPLDQLSRLAGLPGKLGLDGSKVWEAYLAGRIDEIRSYCETDTLNTYLMFLKFQLLRGAFDRTQYDREAALVRDTLGKSHESHWREFLAQWG